MIVNDSRHPPEIARPRTLLICALLITLAACGKPPTAPEEELRNWVASGVEAAEAKERRRLVGMISPAYADSRGNDRNAARLSKLAVPMAAHVESTKKDFWCMKPAV